MQDGTQIQRRRRGLRRARVATVEGVLERCAWESGLQVEATL